MPEISSEYRGGVMKRRDKGDWIWGAKGLDDGLNYGHGVSSTHGEALAECTNLVIQLRQHYLGYVGGEFRCR